MKKRETFKSRVWKKAKQDTFGSSLATIKTLLYAVVFAIVVAVARRYVFGWNSAMNYIQEFGVDFILAGGLFVIVQLVFNLIFLAPYHVGKEQQDEIKKIKDKWEGEKIKLNNVIFTPQEEKDGDILYAWLKIENGEQHDLENCYADLQVVMIMKNDGWVDVTSKVVKLTPKLLWPKHGEDQITIKRKPSWERLNVALIFLNSVHGDKEYFTFSGVNGHATDGVEERIYFEVGLNAKIQGRAIEEISFKGFVVAKRKSVREYVPEIKSPPLLKTVIDKFYIEEGKI
jgi:hypothetical protein